MISMERLTPKIKEIAKRISETENKRMKVADFLKRISKDIKIKYRMKADGLKNVKVVGVDGGIVKKNLHGFDCILTRSVGVCFHYINGVIKDVRYYPSKSPVPIPEVKESLSDLDFSYFSSLLRIKSEIKTALKSIETFKPDVLLLDGSIVLHYSNKPSRTSETYKLYEDVVILYKKLFQRALRNETILAGVIEDSRSSNFCNMIKENIISKIKSEATYEIEKILEKTIDTSLLYLILEIGERTISFPYTKDNEHHIILKDFGNISKDIYTFYIKTSKFDRPLKIDILGKKYVKKLSSIIVSISGHHPNYGLPAPIVEADHVAKLSEMDMERFYSSLCNYTGNIPSLMKLRREERPF